MSTEADKTNTAVIGTMLAMGAAAMIGGTAALVSLARGEVHEQSQELEGYADLNSIRDLEAQQEKQLSSAKVSITKAQAAVIAEIQKDPSSASPAVAEPEPEEAADAGAGDAGAPEGEAEPEEPGEGAAEEAAEGADPAPEAPRPTAAPSPKPPTTGEKTPSTEGDSP